MLKPHILFVHLHLFALNRTYAILPRNLTQPDGTTLIRLYGDESEKITTDDVYNKRHEWSLHLCC